MGVRRKRIASSARVARAYKRLQVWHDGAMTRGRLRIGTFTPSLLIDLARSTGRLDRAGLEVVEAPVPSSPAQFRSLESGEFDVVMTSPDNVLAYRFLSANPLGHNLPVEILAGLDRGLGLSLWLAA
jgi:ABC-type nitrate/sulfonate/bicarbonate transport system substrate-binding protein